MRQKKVYVGARGAPSTEYRRQKSNRLGVQDSVADPLLAKVGLIYNINGCRVDFGKETK